MMKKIISLILFLFCSANCWAISPGLLGNISCGTASESCADSSCTGFETCQNFEGTGYDNSETWTESLNGGTIDEDNTTSPLKGSQSLKILGPSANYSDVHHHFTAAGDLWFHFRIRFTDASPTDGLRYNFSINDSSGNDLLIMKQQTGGLTNIHCGSSISYSNNFFADGTMAHVWVHITKGTGSNAVCDVYVDSTNVRPSVDVHVTNGTFTTDAERLYFYEYNGTTGGTYFDQVLVNDSEIGDVCE